MSGSVGAVRARGISGLAAVTAVVYGVGGLGLLSSTLLYTPGKNPRGVLAGLSALALVLMATALLRGRTFSVVEAELMLVLQLATIAGLTLGSHMDVGAFSNGMGLPLVAFYVGWFLTRRGSVIFGVGLACWVAAQASRGDSMLTTMAFMVAAESLIAVELVRLLLRRLVGVSQTDALTGVLNRHGLRVAGGRLMARAIRRRIPLAVAVIDVDDLRTVNNERGHRAGDELLVRASGQWRSELTPPNVVARIGGDEFVILLPGLTLEAAQQRIDRLARDATAAWTAGVAELLPGESLEQLIERADLAMYERKGSDTAARHNGGRP
jgi:diguanylate cyclase (GGDEF)-like protein